jgi:hypothetical protein
MRPGSTRWHRISKRMSCTRFNWSMQMLRSIGRIGAISHQAGLS